MTSFLSHPSGFISLAVRGGWTGSLAYRTAWEHLMNQGKRGRPVGRHSSDTHLDLRSLPVTCKWVSNKLFLSCCKETKWNVLECDTSLNCYPECDIAKSCQDINSGFYLRTKALPVQRNMLNTAQPRLAKWPECPFSATDRTAQWDSSHGWSSS